MLTKDDMSVQQLSKQASARCMQCKRDGKNDYMWHDGWWFAYATIEGTFTFKFLRQTLSPLKICPCQAWQCSMSMYGKVWSSHKVFVSLAVCFSHRQSASDRSSCKHSTRFMAMIKQDTGCLSQSCRKGFVQHSAIRVFNFCRMQTVRFACKHENLCICHFKVVVCLKQGTAS